ncbi:winged helix-turn-helix domain-containing protein (plasmid) [Natrinema zhouii]|uniref:MarR family transcriptional regulator n=1 Tax=Natrinema zhouii TaxID=1710539 RepID=UPI001CFFAE5F|nr:helix-turn-helix domain-containing protein [Natrinema zhouii]UHQ98130.1 winged helix-turn-helix domain-containing protein [Natrinema zhouii]
MIAYLVTHTTEKTALGELPPSAKLVYRVLKYEDELTQKQLVEETLLAARTVRYAIARLEEEGVIVQRMSFQDARQKLYSLSE